MKALRNLLIVMAALAVSGVARADLTPQILLDVKFVSVTNNDLKDLGYDWGWGAGLSVDLPSLPGMNGTPFVKVDYQRIDGDFDGKSESTGVAAGIKLNLTPTIIGSGNIALYLSVGHYTTRAEDISFDEKEKGFGYDAGVQVKVPLLSGLPVISVLFSHRPKTFDHNTDGLVIMLSTNIIR